MLEDPKYFHVTCFRWLYLYLELFKVLSEDLMFNKDHDQFIYIRSKNNRIECKLKDKNIEFIRLNE